MCVAGRMSHSMAIHLLDVNVLIALAWSHHVHHDAVRDWFLRHGDEGWATCPITQCGFVRISSNPKIIGAVASPSQAIVALTNLVRQPGHSFWADDVAFLDTTRVAHQSIRGHQQVTDAYLV